MDDISLILPFGSPEVTQPEDLPISFILKNDDKLLFLVGTDHTKDYQNPQILIIEKLFNTFIKSVNKESAIIAVDGQIKDIPEEITKDKCISQFGEQGYIISLAKKSGISFATVEPTFNQTTSIALDVIKLDPIILSSWAFLNFLTSYVSSEDKLPSQSNVIIKNVVSEISKSHKLVGDVSEVYNQLKKTIAKNSKITLPNAIEDYSDFQITKQKLREAQQPMINGTTIQRTGAEMNRARDYGIFLNIKNLLNSNRTAVFAILGWNHVISEIPAFLACGYKK